MKLPRQLDLAVDPPSKVAELSQRLGVEWPHVAGARTRARDLLERLQSHLLPILPPDTVCVVYGSLARLEFTRGSDVDWTLLVDGRASAEHWDTATRIESLVKELKLSPPTPGGPFGHLTFSHDLIHKIGGDDDTNRNTTQRLLLLLESAPIGNPAAYTRVVRQVLTRYIEEDLVSPGDTPYRVPRFLQNDVSRYWRTMAVDFAHKRRARAKGWALRTAKLRMSRKLMYASGMLSCFSCELVPESQRLHHANTNHVVDHLASLVRSTPLDIMAGFMLQYFGEVSGPAAQLFGAYDEFLGLLDDEDKRMHLRTLHPRDADGNSVYSVVRDLGTNFQAALTDIFFTCDTPVRDHTQRYGVF